MKRVAIVCSVLGLFLTLFPSILVFWGRLTWTTHVHLMFVGMILWFVFAPFWIRSER